MTTSHDGSLEEACLSLHDHLSATAAYPLERQTSRWLGEAEAIAADVAANATALDKETLTKRVRQVDGLLTAAGDPRHEEASQHVTAATEACNAILEEAR